MSMRARYLSRGRTLVSTVLMLATATVASAQPVAKALTVQHSRTTGLASFVTAADAGSIPVAVPAGRAKPQPIDFLNEHGALFGITDPTRQLVVRKVATDAIGHVHTSYAQVHKGVPVFSGIIKVHQNTAADFLAANGDFYPLPDTLITVATLDSAEAERIVLAAFPTSGARVASSELVIVDPGWYGDPSKGARLAYHIKVTETTGPAHEAFFVDAHRGEVLDRWSLVHTAKDRSVHDASLLTNTCCVPHVGPGCQDSNCSNSACFFVPECCTLNWSESCVEVAAFVCGDLCVPGPLARAEGDGPTGDPEVDNTYDYYGDTYEYFSRGHGRDAIDGLGSTIVGTVNVSSTLACPNAAWLSEFRQNFFCPGTTTDDIVAHEYFHGVTEATADLIYQNQSGQLNESFSDVFGELIDLFNGNAAFAGTPSGPPFWPEAPADAGTDAPNNLRTTCSFSPNHPNGVRWLVGEDSSAFGGPLRDMWAPTCFNHPDRVGSELLPCNPFLDAGGVHVGSGIPNHAFAMVTDGKTFNGQTVAGIGPIKAGAVWYRALTVYLTVASDFRDAARAFHQSAKDLVGASLFDPRTGTQSGVLFTAFDALQVEKSLLAVEMDRDTVCGANVLDDTPPVPCASRVVVYDNDFDTDASDWTQSSTSPPTNYSWVQLTSGLPFSRPGAALFCEDRNIGNCSASNGEPGDEAGVHSLFSPSINMPGDLNQPTLSFLHYMASDPGWDGGNVHISVDDAPFGPIPPESFTFNSYNTELLPGPGNNNPLASEPAWSGFGGRWGTSLVDLSPYVSGGETIRFRFDFGKDRCIGIDGWYVDDVQVYDADCPRIVAADPGNGEIDARKANDVDDADARYGWTSAVITFDRSPAGIGSDQFVVPQRRAGGEIEDGPRVESVSLLSGNRLNVMLDGSIEAGAWTRITHVPSGSSTCLGFVPADADQDGVSGGADLTALITCLDAGPGNCSLHRCDIDRNGVCTGADLVAAVDHLNGAGDHARWSGFDIGPSLCP